MCPAIEQALKAKAAATQTHWKGAVWTVEIDPWPAFFEPYCSCSALSKHFLRVVSSIMSRQLPNYLSIPCS